MPQAASKTDAYRTLRRDIVELRLKPGAILSIKELCGHFAFSRSPLRDALIRLSQEGLVTLLPQRGTRIARIDFRRVEEERFLRVSVERQVMALFMRSSVGPAAERLETLLAEQEKSVVAVELRRFLDQDDGFHDVFYQAAGKPFCAATIRRVSGHYRRVRLLSCTDPAISGEILRQHREMMAAMRAGDTQRMLSLFDRHLGRLDEEEPAFLRQYPDLFEQSAPAAPRADSLGTDFLLSLKPPSAY